MLCLGEVIDFEVLRQCFDGKPTCGVSMDMLMQFGICDLQKSANILLIKRLSGYVMMWHDVEVLLF